MAGELGPVAAPTGKYVYAVIHRGSAATVRDVVAGAWDSFTDADIADYDVQLTELGTASGEYRGDAPSGLNLTTEGHIAKLYYRDNSSVAIGDTFIGDQHIGLTEANVAALGSDSQSATDLKDFADSGYDPATNKVEGVKTADATTVVNGLANDVITTDSIDDGAIGLAQIADGAITAAKIANGAIDAATFAADVDAEVLSWIVDDATRIDASALNTASTAVGSNGSGLTEAGGTGDHLSAVPDTSGTTTLLGRLTSTRAGYLDNLSAGAVATASKLLKYVRLLARKDAGATIDDITELNEINANSGNGAGVYSNGTDSQEALRDRGDASWVTGPAASAIADAVLDEAMSGHTTAGTLGKAVADTLEDTNELQTNQGNWLTATGFATPTNVTDARDSILSKLLKYFQLLFRSDAAIATDNATELTAVNADGGSGAGDFSNQTEAVEALRDRGDAAYTTATGFSTFNPGSDTVTVGANQDKTGYALTTAYDVYHADIKLNIDDANSQDEYTITWFKNGVRITSGITSPTLQVIKRSDGTDLIASTTPTQIASTGSYKHDATTTARMTAGQDALAIVTATIDAASRTFSTLVGRDSSA
jgi:hypothetical protein